MPELRFTVRWPDHSEQQCYSPSSTLQEFLQVGEAYALSEFMDRSRRALHHASERVRLRYGFACSSAASQLQQLEQRALRYADWPDARVTLTALDHGGPRS